MAKRGTAKAPSRRNADDQPSDEGAVAPLDGPAVGTGEDAKAKAVGKAAPKKVATVTITDIGDHLAATFDIPKSHAKIYLNEAVALIGKQLRKGARVRLSGLGVFQVKKRPARKARNPNTGEPIKVKAGKRVVFAAAQDLKAKL